MGLSSHSVGIFCSFIGLLYGVDDAGVSIGGIYGFLDKLILIGVSNGTKKKYIVKW